MRIVSYQLCIWLFFGRERAAVINVKSTFKHVSYFSCTSGFRYCFSRNYPEKTKTLLPKFEKLSKVLLALAIISVVKENYGLEIANFSQLLMANITLNVVAISVGVGLAIFMGLSRKDAFTLGIEAGIQNSGLAIIISLTVLENPVYAATAIVYGVVMTGIALTVLLCRKIQLRYSFA